MNEELPDAIVKKRMLKCINCDGDHEFATPCASCPNGKWGPEFCDELILKQPVERVGQYFVLNDTDDEKTQKAKIFLKNAFEFSQKQESPELRTMAKTALQATSRWALNGFAKTEKETLKTRLKACHGCEFWNPQGFKGTGRCMKCGCSTWAKLRMATEKCPIGKW